MDKNVTRALQLNAADNVATLLQTCDSGRRVEVVDAAGELVVQLNAGQRIAVGHKIALRPLGCGEKVYKYGYVIGVTSQEVAAGQWVHTHNLDSCRGRGDL